MNVQANAKRLMALNTAELRAEYERLWKEPARSNNKAYLAKRVLWKMQADAEHAGLSERALGRAEELATGDARLRPGLEIHAAFAAAPEHPSLKAATLLPGTILTRDYKGSRVIVRVLDNGFEYDGRKFSSLTAIAKHITGSDWNGRLFFGLTKGTKAA